MGTVYKRGNVWWIRYRQNGKNVFESSKSGKKSVANELLKSREGDITKGIEPNRAYDKTKYRDLRKDMLNEYEINGKSVRRLKVSLKHLDPHFNGLKAVQITTSKVQEYTKSRLEEGAANATINRELAALKRMLKLGYQGDIVARVPHIPMLRENNVRQGFFESEEYLKLYKALPAYVRPIAAFGYRTGWRKNEILSLTWDRVDLKERSVKLTPDQTKNKNARSIYLDDELLKLLKIQRMRRGRCKFVFHRNGKKISNFIKAWKNACEEVGLEGKLFHDFRRTAARNLTRSGTKETVAMKITGHKTRSVFDRYNITSEDDIKQAMERQQDYLENGVVTDSVTSEENQKSEGGQVLNIK